MSTTAGAKEYAVLLFDGIPGEKNAPKSQAKGLSANEAGQKAQSWLELADLYVAFPYIVIMGPPGDTTPAPAAAKSPPFPPSPPGG